MTGVLVSVLQLEFVVGLVSSCYVRVYFFKTVLVLIFNFPMYSPIRIL